METRETDASQPLRAGAIARSPCTHNEDNTSLRIPWAMIAAQALAGAFPCTDQKQAQR